MRAVTFKEMSPSTEPLPRSASTIPMSLADILADIMTVRMPAVRPTPVKLNRQQPDRQSSSEIPRLSAQRRKATYVRRDYTIYPLPFEEALKKALREFYFELNFVPELRLSVERVLELMSMTSKDAMWILDHLNVIADSSIDRNRIVCIAPRGE